MKRAKSKQTQAKEISIETKKRVLERQHNKSISGVAINLNSDFHHYVFRSHGGVGYEWNIVGLTREEHDILHDIIKGDIKVNGRGRYSKDEFLTLIRNHFKTEYVNWSEEKCHYNKYFDSEEEYGVKRRERKL